MSMLEAECTRCKEIFVPHGTSPEDLIHGETYAGKDCGGIGVILGDWLIPDKTPSLIENLSEAVLLQEQHGQAAPFCQDLNCPHHFPKPDLEYHSDSC